MSSKISSFFAPKKKRVAEPAAEGEQKQESPKKAKTTEQPASSSTFSSSSATAKPQSTTAATANSPPTLLTHLTSPTWRTALSKSTSSQSFKTLSTFVQSQRSGSHKIYPPEAEVFSAFNLTDLSDVKVVIIGQDPYHGPGQGHGLSFSVKRGIAIPPSLRNIYKEAVSDGVMKRKPAHGNLEHWASQGVFCMNVVMTVRGGEANSHAKKGWEDFTDSVVRTLNREKSGLVFMLWGKPAQVKGQSVDKKKHSVITSSHPSPLGATKTAEPFIGSKCFSRCNEKLVEAGQEPIDWELPL
jgi:uracil-DNA glycosylase